MASDTLLKKLQIKPGAKLWLINVPKKFAAALTDGNDVQSVQAGAAFDGAIAFCESPADVEEFTRRILAKAPEDAVLWFAYRKGTAAKLSGLNRDIGWKPLADAGWRGVRSVSFDRTWSGLRFRPAALVKSKRSLEGLMASADRRSNWIVALACLMPWLWLVCLALFATLVAEKFGHWPSYSNPDPKQTGLGGLHLLTMLLLLLALISPIVVGLTVSVDHLTRRALPIAPAFLIVHGISVVLCAGIILGDAYGLMTWLLD